MRHQEITTTNTWNTSTSVLNAKHTQEQEHLQWELLLYVYEQL